MRHHYCRFPSIPARVCIAWGQGVWLHPFPASFIFERAWYYFASNLHKWKPAFISSLTLPIFNLISQHTPSSDPIRFFPTLYTLLGSKRAWTMNIYQHDLWFVSRFEDNMLIFQVSRSNSFQTKTEISCKTNTGNRLFRGIQRDSFLLSSFIKHSRVLHAEGCPVSPGGARVKDLSSWTEIRFSTNEDSSTQCVHLHAWFQNHMSYRKPHSGS